MFTDLLLIILFGLILACLLEIIWVYPPPFKIIDKQKLYVNKPLSYIRPTEVPIVYKKNDIINNITKDKEHKNIKYKTSDLGDTCETSNDCPNELICSSIDNINFKCNRTLPENYCYLKTCDNKISYLGDSCGMTENMLGNFPVCAKDEDLKCTTSSLMNNAVGICSIVR